jgi:hypothetical protein
MAATASRSKTCLSGPGSSSSLDHCRKAFSISLQIVDAAPKADHTRDGPSQASEVITTIFDDAVFDSGAVIGLSRVCRTRKFFCKLHDATPSCFGKPGNISAPGEAPTKKGVPGVSRPPFVAKKEDPTKCRSRPARPAIADEKHGALILFGAPPCPMVECRRLVYLNGRQRHRYRVGAAW